MPHAPYLRGVHPTSLSMRDRAVNLPARRDDAFKKAPREADRGAQGALDL
jgi:hypothetical protein